MKAVVNQSGLYKEMHRLWQTMEGSIRRMHPRVLWILAIFCQTLVSLIVEVVQRSWKAAINIKSR